MVFTITYCNSKENPQRDRVDILVAQQIIVIIRIVPGTTHVEKERPLVNRSQGNGDGSAALDRNVQMDSVEMDIVGIGIFQAGTGVASLNGDCSAAPDRNAKMDIMGNGIVQVGTEWRVSMVMACRRSEL